MKKDYFLTENTVTTASQYLKDRPAYIFHHLMKSGGTSLRKILGKWFNVINDYHETVEISQKYLRNRIDINKISSDYCIAGHYHTDGIFVLQRYPEIIYRKHEIRCFTFLREPLDFFISFYYYSKNVGRMESTLQEFIDRNRNLLAYYLGCDEIDDFRDVLDKYFFIGVTENLQNSMNKLAKMVNKSELRVPVFNKSEKDEQISLLTQEFKVKFKKDNELDYEIYQYTKDKFKL